MPTSPPRVAPERSPGSPVLGRLLGPRGTLVAGVVFAALTTLVEVGWDPLRRFDLAVVDAMNTALSDQSWAVTLLHLVTDLGGTEAAWTLLTVATIWLLIRRLGRSAVYVAITGLGAGALSVGTKALVDRARPMVDVVVATAPDPSFPSGHALGSTVTYGVLLLVFLPAVPARARRVVSAAAIALVIAIGLTRVALGVHFPSDVLGGWTLGVVWLAVTSAAFREWRAGDGRTRPALDEGLEPERRAELVPAPEHDAVWPHGWVSVAQLVVGAVIVAAALFGLGALVTDVFPGAVRPVDVAIVEWFVDLRTDTLSTVAVAVGRLGGTAGIVLLLVVAVPASVAATRRWTPGVFLLVAVAGETAIFLAVSTLVGRARPPVEHLSPELPPTSSFPSGHVAAATVAYVGIALLVRAWARGWIGPVASVIAVLVPLGVALSRLYRGVHYPTDVLASVLYASVWLAICWHALQPARGAPPGQRALQTDGTRPEGVDR